VEIIREMFWVLWAGAALVGARRSRDNDDDDDDKDDDDDDVEVLLTPADCDDRPCVSADTESSADGSGLSAACRDALVGPGHPEVRSPGWSRTGRPTGGLDAVGIVDKEVEVEPGDVVTTAGRVLTAATERDELVGGDSVLSACNRQYRNPNF